MSVTINEHLFALMSKHHLTSQQVADMLYVSLSTVQKWRQTPGNISHYEMPEGLLELLRIKTGEIKWQV
jgi:DNA-binding transcriptional regulator YiaG